MTYWTSSAPDLRILENSVVGKLRYFPLFLAHINLCTVEVNACLCEAVDYIDSLLGVTHNAS